MKSPSNFVTAMFVTLAVGVLGSLIWIFGFFSNSSPREAQSPVFGNCINGLRIIRNAKGAWAYENPSLQLQKERPTLQDLAPYTGWHRDYSEDDISWLKCPAGGTYNVGNVYEPPTCSIPHHSLYFGFFFITDEQGIPLPEVQISTTASGEATHHFVTDAEGIASVAPFQASMVGNWKEKPYRIHISREGFNEVFLDNPKVWPTRVALKKIE